MSIRDDVDYEDDQREQQIKKRKKLMNFSIESIMQPAAAAAAVVAAAASAAATNNNIKSSPSAATPVNHEQLNSARLNQIECQLDNKDMWDKFHSLNTEMIITKTGRRMFPVMKVQFQNLNPTARYSVAMDIVPVDNKRYRYAYHKSCWQVAGKADPSAETRLYMHPDSPFNGDLLSRQVISFEKVKLTNNEMDKSGHIILNSMHKYQPRVYLIELKSPPPPQNHQLAQQATAQLNHHHRQTTSKQHQSYYQQSSPNGQQQQQQQQPQLQSDIEGYRTFVFPETVFTAVTAYQNQLITKMKIDKNPFAKGFRDSSRLSDLDRSDPFDYMSSLSSSARFLGQHASSMPPGPGPSPGSLDHHSLAAAAAAAAGANLHPHPMDAYQLLASAAANNPWYSAAAMAAAAGGNLPFNSMMGPITNTGAASNNSAASPTGPPQQPLPPPPTSSSAAACSQAAQLQATQMWLAAFSACLYGSGGCPPTSQQHQHHLQQQQQQQHNQQHSQHQQPTSPALPSSANSSPPIPDQLINETSGGCDSSENSSSY